MNQKQIGIVAVLIAALMWALEPIFAKLSYTDASFLQTSIIRAYIVIIIAVLYAIIKKKHVFKIEKKSIPAFMYIAIFGTLVADLLYFYAFLHTSVLI